MAEYYFPDLVEAMNHLWFHHIILFSEPMSLLSPKITKPIPEIPLNSPSSTDLSSTPPPEEEISEESSPIRPQDDSNNEDIESNSSNKERPTRLNIVPTKTRSHSSSPLLKKTQKHLRYSSCAGRRLQKTMSCKGLWELEYQEVKGFMDLGFTFKKEHLNPRLMSVIPGLQRLREYEEEQEERQVEERSKEDEIEEEEEEKRGVMRPYLSEAWLIKRPDSPLLDLRIPRASAAADMKKHLRYWARTVASVIQQES